MVTNATHSPATLTSGRLAAAGFSLALAALALAPAPAAAQEPGEAAAVEEEEPPPTWRFKQADKPVKVVVLAGSVGAWQREPYADRFESLCRNIEVKNLSKVGYGAYQLKQRFKSQVLENTRLGLHKRDDGQEFWLVFHGGLNSVAMPEQTNHHIRALFETAHKRDFKVVALTLTPWGDDDDKRWRGARALEYVHDTRAVVDFVLGKLTPAQALGSHARKRSVEPDAPWADSERPDVSVDLYNSSLRDAGAAVRDLDAMRDLLARDKDWKRAHKALSEDERAAALERDAALLAEIPRWYMRQELRSFDHIHPNTEGHRLIALEACPHLPESWGCSCPEAPPRPAGSAPAPASSSTPDVDAAAKAALFGQPYGHWGWLLLRVLLGAKV